MPQNQVALCRSVYYRDQQGHDHAAVIVHVKDDGKPVLMVFNYEDGDDPMWMVEDAKEFKTQSPEGSPGVPGNTWRWPRVV